MRKAEKWMAKRFPTSEPSSLGSAGFQPVSGLGPSRPHQGASEPRHLGLGSSCSYSSVVDVGIYHPQNGMQSW
jgi:hypothetical protein